MLNIKTHTAMTKEQFTAIATAKLNALSVSDLMVEAQKLVNNFNAPTIVFDTLMDVLMERMPEDEFVKFCDTL